MRHALTPQFCPKQTTSYGDESQVTTCLGEKEGPAHATPQNQIWGAGFRRGPKIVSERQVNISSNLQ